MDTGRAVGESVLHLDLHPLNVLMGPRGPVVIDWCNARSGPAGLDRAVTALVLAQVASSGPADLRSAARPLLNPVLAALGSLPDRDLARAYRAADPNLSRAEAERLGEAVELLEAFERRPDSSGR